MKENIVFTIAITAMLWGIHFVHATKEHQLPKQFKVQKIAYEKEVQGEIDESIEFSIFYFVEENDTFYITETLSI